MGGSQPFTRSHSRETDDLALPNGGLGGTESYWDASYPPPDKGGTSGPNNNDGGDGSTPPRKTDEKGGHTKKGKDDGHKGGKRPEKKKKRPRPKTVTKPNNWDAYCKKPENQERCMDIINQATHDRQFAVQMFGPYTTPATMPPVERSDAKKKCHQIPSCVEKARERYRKTMMRQTFEQRSGLFPGKTRASPLQIAAIACALLVLLVLAILAYCCFCDRKGGTGGRTSKRTLARGKSIKAPTRSSKKTSGRSKQLATSCGTGGTGGGGVSLKKFNLKPKAVSKSRPRSRAGTSKKLTLLSKISGKSANAPKGRPKSYKLGSAKITIKMPEKMMQ